jgi:predicted dienelactone hydrolase
VKKERSMNAVLRTLRRVLVIGTVAVVVIVGVVAQAGAYLFGFTTTQTRPNESAYAGLSYSAPGRHPVGVRRIGPEEDAPVGMTVWYPASESIDEEPPMTYSYALKVLGPSSSTALATYQGAASLGAAADRSGSPYPLVVLSSGFAITSGSYAWLAEHLASYGIVVVAPQHEETLDPRTLWRAAGARTDTIAQTRAYLESAARSGGVLAGLVDPHKVAVVGHSYGGYTALASGGARLDADAFAAGCATARKDSDPIVFLCDALEPRFDQIIAAADQAPVENLPPVDAVVSLAGDAAMFGEPGLRSLTEPLLVIGGTADHDSPYDWSTRLAYEGAASTHKIEVALDGAEHFVFSGRCASVRRIVALVPMGFCDDPAWNRARARAVIRHYVAAFLLAELTDESDAKSALSSGGTAVPQVRYRTVGY